MTVARLTPLLSAAASRQLDPGPDVLTNLGVAYTYLPDSLNAMKCFQVGAGGRRAVSCRPPR